MRNASRQAWPLIVAAAAFTLAAGRPPSDPDMWWHLASGRWMVEHFAILKIDLFSSTSTGVPYALGEWLGEVLLYLAYAAGSWTGVIVLRSTLVAVAAFFVTRLGLRSAPPLVAVPLAGVALILSSPTWTDRPQLFTLALFPLLLDLLFAARDGSRRAAMAVVPLVILWSALHAGYTVGLALVFLFTIEAIVSRRAWLALGSAAVVATLLAPLMPGSLSLIRAFSHVAGATVGIVEESPVDVLTPFGALFALFVGAVLLLFMLRGGSLLAALVLCPLLLLALAAQRHIPLFGFAAAIFLAPALALAGPAGARRSRPLVGSASAAAFGLGGDHAERAAFGSARSVRSPSFLAYATAGSPRLPSALALALLLWAGAIASVALAPRVPDERAYPVGAAEALRASSGVLLNEYDWGGWLIWNVPGRPVFVDGRLYPFTTNGVLDDYRDAVRLLPRWPSVISKWSVSQALLRKDRPLVEALRDQGWTVSAEGSDYVLLELPQ